LAILKGCQLNVEAYESLAIVGRSGSGKSTLLALMAGLDSPTEGEVHLLGQNLSPMSEDQRARLRAKQVGFVFQNFQLMPGMNALENVMMPLELFGMAQAREKATAALEKVGLSHRLHHTPQALSGGEQQRVAIARAIVTEPKILFADEPTGNLDETTAAQVQQLLFDLQQQTTLILVTHDRQFAQRCQRQVTLTQGLLQDGLQ
jgi:putative ABC transport system ATP-binding protein